MKEVTVDILPRFVQLRSHCSDSPVMETTKGRFLIKRSATPASLAQLAEGSLLMFLRNIPRLASSLVRSWAQRSLPWLVRESLLHRLSVDWGGVEDRRRTVQKVWSLLYSCSITTIDLPAWLGKFPVWPPVRVNFISKLTQMSPHDSLLSPIWDVTTRRLPRLPWQVISICNPYDDNLYQS